MSPARLPVLAALAFSLACSSTPPGPAADKSADTKYADSMAHEHAGEAPVASPAAAAEPEQSVVAHEVVYATLDGNSITGYLARPLELAGGGPAVLVIQEWWGLNDNIRSMARQLAGQGYTALAVDLYEGKTAETPEQARELMTASMENPERVKENLRQGVAYLKEQAGAGRVGTIGWCFGGGWSLQTAPMLPDKIDAAVMYYGRVETDAVTLAALRAPLLGLFGEADQGIPVEGVREFQARLAELGKSAEIHIYPGAGHAFANPSGQSYLAGPAEDAWAKTLAFFAAHLR